MFDVVPANVDEPALRARFEPERALDEDYPIAGRGNARRRQGDRRQRAISATRWSSAAIRCWRWRPSADGFRWQALVRQLRNPRNPNARNARAHLSQLRGRMHRASCVRWRWPRAARCCGRAPTALDSPCGIFPRASSTSYLARAGERVCQSVGAYQLEGLGVQLFESIEGDYFTILGLPLLPLLEELRERERDRDMISVSSVRHRLADRAFALAAHPWPLAEDAMVSTAAMTKMAVPAGARPARSSRSLEARGLEGCNVTAPHKEAAFEAARLARSVGGSRRRGEHAVARWRQGLRAANTDTYGFMTHLEPVGARMGQRRTRRSRCSAPAERRAPSSMDFSRRASARCG